MLSFATSFVEAWHLVLCFAVQLLFELPVAEQAQWMAAIEVGLGQTASADAFMDELGSLSSTNAYKMLVYLLQKSQSIDDLRLRVKVAHKSVAARSLTRHHIAYQITAYLQGYLKKLTRGMGDRLFKEYTALRGRLPIVQGPLIEVREPEFDYEEAIQEFVGKIRPEKSHREFVLRANELPASFVEMELRSEYNRRQEDHMRMTRELARRYLNENAVSSAAEWLSQGIVKGWHEGDTVRTFQQLVELYQLLHEFPNIRVKMDGHKIRELLNEKRAEVTDSEMFSHQAAMSLGYINVSYGLINGHLMESVLNSSFKSNHLVRMSLQAYHVAWAREVAVQIELHAAYGNYGKLLGKLALASHYARQTDVPIECRAYVESLRVVVKGVVLGLTNEAGNEAESFRKSLEGEAPAICFDHACSLSILYTVMMAKKGHRGTSYYLHSAELLKWSKHPLVRLIGLETVIEARLIGDPPEVTLSEVETRLRKTQYHDVRERLLYYHLRGECLLRMTDNSVDLWLDTCEVLEKGLDLSQRLGHQTIHAKFEVQYAQLQTIVHESFPPISRVGLFPPIVMSAVIALARASGDESTWQEADYAVNHLYARCGDQRLVELVASMKMPGWQSAGSIEIEQFEYCLPILPQ